MPRGFRWACTHPERSACRGCARARSSARRRSARRETARLRKAPVSRRRHRAQSPRRSRTRPAGRRERVRSRAARPASSASLPNTSRRRHRASGTPRPNQQAWRCGRCRSAWLAGEWKRFQTRAAYAGNCPATPYRVKTICLRRAPLVIPRACMRSRNSRLGAIPARRDVFSYCDRLAQASEFRPGAPGWHPDTSHAIGITTID